MEAVEIKNPGASANAIQYHYDVGNDFYSLWLDSNLNYSCALWKEGDTIDSAQLRKVEFHIERAKAYEAKRILDIGCGWGSVLKSLVENPEVECAVGLTLSEAQAEWLSAIENPKLKIHLESWSNHSFEEPYDSIISIGAFEHFSKWEYSNEEKIKGYRDYFLRCHEMLKPGKWMTLQTMAYGNLRRGKSYLDPFIANEIFPQSDFPCLADIAKASEFLFEVVEVRNDRLDYARTFREWFERLRAKRSEAIRIVGEDTVARYERYLRTFSYSFELGAFDLLRITFQALINLCK